MTTAGIQDRETMAAEYLSALHALTGELERAMQAIANNALAELEESVANQQRISSQLGALAERLSLPLEGSSAISQAHAEEDMMRQIRQAGGTLDKLNRRYAALLQHASRSVALMASLFGSFQGQFQEASGPGLKHQTWSCQM
jgi:hypothetical protein